MKKHPLSIAIGFAILSTGSNSLAAEEPAQPAESSQPSYYTVQKGDTLGEIALEIYGRSSAFRRIYEANRDVLDSPDLIYPDQVLLLPHGGQQTEFVSAQSAASPDPDLTLVEDEAGHATPPEPEPDPPEAIPESQITASEPAQSAGTEHDTDSFLAEEEALATENRELRSSVSDLESQIDTLQAENQALKTELAETHARLSAILNEAQNRSPQDLGTPSVGGAYQFRTPPESAVGEEFYRRGVEALSKNEPAEAVRLFLLAAAEANPKSMNALGNLYMRGHGTIPSSREAYIWFLRASELGHVTAMRNLARLYEAGNGVRSSEHKAAYWNQLAASVEAGEASLVTK